MTKYLMAGLVAGGLLLSGCTLQQYAKQAVSSYCGLAPEARAANRALVAAAVAPNKIQIECVSDPES